MINKNIQKVVKWIKNPESVSNEELRGMYLETKDHNPNSDLEYNIAFVCETAYASVLCALKGDKEGKDDCRSFAYCGVKNYSNLTGEVIEL